MSKHLLGIVGHGLSTYCTIFMLTWGFSCNVLCRLPIFSYLDLAYAPFTTSLENPHDFDNNMVRVNSLIAYYRETKLAFVMDFKGSIKMLLHQRQNNKNLVLSNPTTTNFHDINHYLIWTGYVVCVGFRGEPLPLLATALSVSLAKLLSLLPIPPMLVVVCANWKKRLALITPHRASQLWRSTYSAMRWYCEDR